MEEVIPFLFHNLCYILLLPQPFAFYVLPNSYHPLSVLFCNINRINVWNLMSHYSVVNCSYSVSLLVVCVCSSALDMCFLYYL
jgi:hypothetical protein